MKFRAISRGKPHALRDSLVCQRESKCANVDAHKHLDTPGHALRQLGIDSDRLTILRVDPRFAITVYYAPPVPQFAEIYCRHICASIPHMWNSMPISRRKAIAITGYSLAIAPLLRAGDTPEAAPRFNAKTLAGKVVLIEFWTTWCPYCRNDAGTLDDLAVEFQKDGLIVLAVDVAESKKKVTAYLSANPRKAKIVLMTDTNLAAMFAATSFPYYVLINREGGVAAEQRGSGGELSLRQLSRRAGLESEGIDDAPVELRASPRRGV